jgi:hypothetical protein
VQIFLLRNLQRPQHASGTNFELPKIAADRADLLLIVMRNYAAQFSSHASAVAKQTV